MNGTLVRRRQRSPLLYALLVVLLPTLIACGGTATAPTALRNASTAASTAAASTAAGLPSRSRPASNADSAAASAAASSTTDSARAYPEAASTAALAEASTAAAAGAAPAAPPGAPDADVGAAPPGAPETEAYAAPARHPRPQTDAPNAGEVDDNADFDQYLSYLRSYQGPRALPVDVTERVLIQVTDAQQRPVYDAHVQLFHNRRSVFEGRTYADGRTILLPRAIGIDQQSQGLELLVEKGNQQLHTTLQLYGQPTNIASVVLPEAVPVDRPRLDLLFLLDATGSMGDEIGRLQETIASIAERVDAAQTRPDLRFGLVAYKDRGDDYVTQVYDFTPDVQQFRSTLLQVQAGGGGDEPESLNAALHDAISGVSWSDNALRLVFLVADAPPHLDYWQDYDYVTELQSAVAGGIKVFPIAASNSSEQAEYVFRQLAQQTLGTFIFLTYQPGQNAGVPGQSTVHNVDPAQFTVERLDDLVVQVVERELAHARGW